MLSGRSTVMLHFKSLTFLFKLVVVAHVADFLVVHWGAIYQIRNPSLNPSNVFNHVQCGKKIDPHPS